MKPIFEGNASIAKSAFLNWRVTKDNDIENMIALAEGFLSSSIDLAKACLTDNSDNKADMLIFPILTNANHGIELYLKAMVAVFSILLNENPKVGGHNIKQLYQTLKAKIKRCQDQKSANYFAKQTKETAKYIEELFKLTGGKNGKDKMDFSRYPVDSDQENHFYVEELDNVVIDLENFVERFEIIREQLDERASYYYHNLLLEDY